MNLFEYDQQKSLANLEKHGIDFVDAQELWEDADLFEINAKTADEPRTLVIGSIGAKVWSAVITHRGDAIRIISVRRARKAEVALYES
jgi:hypothetical protein